MPEGMFSVKSDTFGLTHTRDAERTSINTDTAEFKYFARLQAEWLRGKLRDMDSPLQEFLFTSTTVNFDYAARRHTDSRNVGPSLLLALGEFTRRYF